jgi:hypothetical protein
MNPNMRHGIAAAVVTGFSILAAAGSAHAQSNIYPTYGTHNPPEFSKCESPDCVYERKAGEPTDPKFPDYWSSNWKMYRVHNGYVEYPPPYDGKPPAPLKEGQDYETSEGATYYDSTYRSLMGEGAMMEHYEKKCLPIFPIPNGYTCSFVSLGDRAFFLTYEQDRPAGMPPCCLFSPLNHPPRTDFVKHLPYSIGDSERLGMTVQGYSFWVGQDGKPMQVGVSPDQTANGGIMFGYAFNSTPTADAGDPTGEKYRHPQSFYFSGVPKTKDTPLPTAPIVTQNYTNFAKVRPDPAKTWDQVAKMCTGAIPDCRLFDPPAPKAAKAEASPNGSEAQTWGDIPLK